MEAVQLLEAKGAYSIKNYEELEALLDRLFSDKAFLSETGLMPDIMSPVMPGQQREYCI